MPDYDAIAARIRAVTSDNDPEDPIVTNFLSFLEKDMTKHPERLAVLNDEFFAKSAELIQNVDIYDIDGPLADA